MKYFLVLCLLVFALGLAAGARIRRGDEYTNKYDNIDLDEILNNDRFLSSCFKCLMEQGVCSPECGDLKKVVPEALQTGCSKCSDKQKEGAKKVIKFLTEKKPDQWEELQEKYDPDGKYRKLYEEEAKNL